MANTIALFKAYLTNVLDAVYAQESKSGVLDGAPELATAGANADELIIPKMSMQGLGTYDRNGGYVAGDVSVTNETVKCNFDRGRMFTVDALDDQETAGVAFGRLAGEFIRTKVVPEEDAFRFASYAGATGISKVATGVALATGAEVIAALRVATSKMDEDGVPYNERYLFITPTLYGLVQDMDTTKSREVMSRFVFDPIRSLVQQTTFYTAITQYDGSTAGQEAGSYIKASGAKNINFLIVQKSAAIQFTKHVAPKIITPDMNQTGDGWKFGYRKVGIAETYENKVAGIYLHHAAA